MRFVSTSPGQTQQLGQTLGHLLNNGCVVALIGSLGAGKTVFAQGLARGLGVGPDEYVSSPSFALVNQYRGRVPIFHIDAYRLRHEAEMVALGFEEYFEPDGVTVIEWADKVQGLLPDKHARVKLEITGPTSRAIELELMGAWSPQKSVEIECAFGQRMVEKP